MRLRFQVNTRLDGPGARLMDPETGEELSRCTFALLLGERWDRITVDLEIENGERFLPQMLDPWPLKAGKPSATPG